MEQEQMIFSVSEANNFIKTLLDQVPQLQEIYVRGEISNYKLYPSGHHYFTLKDESGAMRCVMFKGQATHLRFRPENGMKVIAFGRISVFPRDGAYQLYCSELSPEGVGDLHVAFEQLKEKLYKEGLFDSSHKKPLPKYPQRIAIVTSSAGAAVHDMIRILRARYPLAKVILLPVRVQGVEAPPEIVGALRYANKWKVADVIITGRGGGSIEDLWAFNDERVARAIYDSEIPVISAVGHEPDVTIADFVADARASTPSNAAEIAVPDQRELRRRFALLESRMTQSETVRLQYQRKRWQELSRKRVMLDPMAFIADKRMLLDYTQTRLSAFAQQQTSARRQRFGSLCASLDALSPLKVLSRGYAMARDEHGAVVKTAADVEIGGIIDVVLGRGSLRCRVENRNLEDRDDGKNV
ncbi:MAG: exodeoxyribonuclease VII large subunit [Eubacteriales bacterium]|nr:exodeoxyribonuclease VII large subunit [Eubacteriales bacterium]